MYMRVTRGRFDPTRFDEFDQLVLDAVAVIKLLPGCQSYASGVDRASGQLCDVSTWDTEEHARFSRDDPGESAMSRLHAAGVQLDPPEFYEVVAT
jgi:hypothetical protein